MDGLAVVPVEPLAADLESMRTNIGRDGMRPFPRPVRLFRERLPVTAPVIQ